MKLHIFAIVGILASALVFTMGYYFHVTPKTFGSSLYVPVYANMNFASTNASSSVGTLIDAYPGTLHSVTFATPIATSKVVFYDSASSTVQIGTTTVIASFIIPSSPQPFTVTFDGAFANGLVVDQTVATSTITVNYQ